MEMDKLKPWEDKVAELRLADGEWMRAKVAFVYFEYQDVIVNILETNQPERYSVDWAQSGIVILAEEILEISNPS
jgi:hypothetical protein